MKKEQRKRCVKRALSGARMSRVNCWRQDTSRRAESKVSRDEEKCREAGLGRVKWPSNDHKIAGGALRRRREDRTKTKRDTKSRDLGAR